MLVTNGFSNTGGVRLRSGSWIATQWDAADARLYETVVARGWGEVYNQYYSNDRNQGKWEEGSWEIGRGFWKTVEGVGRGLGDE